MKQRILLVLPSLRGGGAERVMNTIVNNLNREKFELHLALITKEGPYIDSISKDVRVYDLQSKKVKNSFIPLVKLIRNLKPDIIFSTIGHLNIALIMIKPFFPRKTRLIIREATIVSEAIKKGQLSAIWKYLYRIFYNKADIIVCQSQYMKHDLINNYNVSEAKTVQIYNPVNIESITIKSIEGQNPFADTNSTPNILAIGRLDPVKGFEQLIESMQGLIKERPFAKLWILGEGALREYLEKRIVELKLQDHVELYGFEENPYRWMRHADLFVLSSLYEGLPNALLEAIGCGCPVITTKHPGGTIEIMELLEFNDRVLDRITFTSDLFVRKERNDKFIECFGLTNVVHQYENLFQQCK